MPMNTMFAAGLFDNPWIVGVLLLVGAVVNWLAKRRQQKAAEQSEVEGASSAADKPPGKFDLEEALRQLMGEEPAAPRPERMPVPPPLPAARAGLPPVLDWEQAEEFHAATAQTVPGLRPAPRLGVSEQQKQADRRFEQLNDQGRHPATVVRHERGHRPSGGRRVATRWRDPQSARHAFVASVVFAPPKSLEP